MNRAATLVVQAPAEVTAGSRQRRAQPQVVSAALALLLAGAAWLAAEYGLRHGDRISRGSRKC